MKTSELLNLLQNDINTNGDRIITINSEILSHVDTFSESIDLRSSKYTPHDNIKTDSPIFSYTTFRIISVLSVIRHINNLKTFTTLKLEPISTHRIRYDIPSSRITLMHPPSFPGDYLIIQIED